MSRQKIYFPQLVIKSKDRIKVISVSDAHPWNGWVEIYDDIENWRNEKPIYSGFETGSYWDALEHLSLCKACRRRSHVRLQTVRKLIKYVRGEWEKEVK